MRRNVFIVATVLVGSVTLNAFHSSSFAGVIPPTTELNSAAEIGGNVAVPNLDTLPGLVFSTAVALQTENDPDFGPIPVGLAEGVALSQTDLPFPSVGSLSLGAGPDTTFSASSSARSVTNWTFSGTPSGDLVDLTVDLSLDGFLLGLNEDGSAGNSVTSVVAQLILHRAGGDEVLFSATADVDPFAAIGAATLTGDWSSGDFTALTDVPSTDLDLLTSTLTLAHGGFLMEAFTRSYTRSVNFDETVAIELILSTSTTGGGFGFQAAMAGFADTGSFALSTTTSGVSIDAVTAVPEPSTLLMAVLGTALLALAFRRRTSTALTAAMARC